MGGQSAVGMCRIIGTRAMWRDSHLRKFELHQSLRVQIGMLSASVACHRDNLNQRGVPRDSLPFALKRSRLSLAEDEPPSTPWDGPPTPPHDQRGRIKSRPSPNLMAGLLAGMMPLHRNLIAISIMNGGSGEIRTHERFPVAGFQDRCNQPLCHASGRSSLATAGRAVQSRRGQSP